MYSFRGDPFSRPRWASRMGALSWGLDLANFEGVPVRLHGFEMENVSMMWSAFVAQVFRQVRVSPASSYVRRSSRALLLLLRPARGRWSRSCLHTSVDLEI